MSHVVLYSIIQKSARISLPGTGRPRTGPADRSVVDLRCGDRSRPERSTKLPAPRQRSDRVPTGPQGPYELPAGVLRVGPLAAGENIGGGVTELRPGMDGDVRLGDQPQGGNTLGVKMVRHFVQEGRTALVDRAAQRVFDEALVVEQFGGAVIQLRDAVRSVHFQSWGTPFRHIPESSTVPRTGHEAPAIHA